MTAQSAVGLAGHVLLVATASGALARRLAAGRAARAVAALTGAALVLVPIDDLSTAARLRGVCGDLSISTLLLLALTLAAVLDLRGRLDERTQTAVCVLASAAACVLYPAFLDLGQFDVYAAGYGTPLFLAVLAAVSLGLWLARLDAIALLVVAAAAAHLAGALESDNLWDYLCDPLLCGYAIGWWMLRIARTLSRSAFNARREGTPAPGVHP